MNLPPALRAELAEAVGAEVLGLRAVSGGDINRAFEATLTDGRRLFVKCNGSASPGLFEREARGLAWLAEADAIATPKVLAVGRRVPFLALSWLDRVAPTTASDEALGRGLAALHRHGAASFGLDHDNFIGSLAQSNAPTEDWPSFYDQRRLAPLTEAAAERHLLPPSTRRAMDEVRARLPELVGPPEPPSRLHGDLWGGNAMVTARLGATLIDPAVYAGHREVDLAMMRLFGGFSRRVFDAYQEAFPLAAGHERRVPLYQLYPLLVHVLLFGGGYAGQLERAAHAALGSGEDR